MYVCLILIGRRHWRAAATGMHCSGITRRGPSRWRRRRRADCASFPRTIDVRTRRSTAPIRFRVNRQYSDHLHDDELRRIEKECEDLAKQKEKQSADKDEAGKKALDKINNDLANARPPQKIRHPADIDRSLCQPEYARGVYGQARRSLVEAARVREPGWRQNQGRDPRGRALQRSGRPRPRKSTASRPGPFCSGSHGAVSQDKIFLGAAFVHGTSREVIKFFELGIPVEYELIRSIATVAQQKKKTLGLIDTLGGDMSRALRRSRKGHARRIGEAVQGGNISPYGQDRDWSIPTTPTRSGNTTCSRRAAFAPWARRDCAMSWRRFAAASRPPIFEDPLPLWTGVPGTSQPRRSPTNPMMPSNSRRKCPRGTSMSFGICSAFGSRVKSPRRMPSESISSRIRAGGGFETLTVWQDYNPYRQLRSGRPAYQRLHFRS